MTPAPINGQLATATQVMTQVVALAAAHPEVAVLWLYGSHAKGNAGPHSDWDLAVAFDPIKCAGPFGQLLETRLRPELLALDWQRTLGLAQGQLSIVDINQAPTPLAFAIVDANRVLFCRDQGRRLTEEARIMSQMEINFRSPTHCSYQE
ncbi:MAG: type VII toxin-antitoxin system MntA family adenylyltransferase antitoxin [Aeromonas sp.]